MLDFEVFSSQGGVYFVVSLRIVSLFLDSAQPPIVR